MSALDLQDRAQLRIVGEPGRRLRQGPLGLVGQVAIRERGAQIAQRRAGVGRIELPEEADRFEVRVLGLRQPARAVEEVDSDVAISGPGDGRPRDDPRPGWVRGLARPMLRG